MLERGVVTPAGLIGIDEDAIAFMQVLATRTLAPTLWALKVHAKAFSIHGRGSRGLALAFARRVICTTSTTFTATFASSIVVATVVATASITMVSMATSLVTTSMVATLIATMISMATSLVTILVATVLATSMLHVLVPNQECRLHLPRCRFF